MRFSANLADMKTIKQIFIDNKTGETTVRGWVRTHRQSKNVSFIEITDGSGQRGLQIVIEPSLAGYAEIAQQITTGSSIIVSGELKESLGKGQSLELLASSLELVGTADPETYPLQKKGHTLEFLREHLHLRARSNTIGATMRVRAHVSQAINQFFYENGFLYVHTPIITASDCEGAGEMFQVTTMDLAKMPMENGKVKFSDDFFKERAHLTVSGQLNGEIMAMALGKIYTFGPTFRAENSNTVRHLAEFWMIEPEAAFYQLEDNMKLAENFIKYLINATFKNCADELAFLHEREWVSPGIKESLQHVAESNFEVLDYTEVIKILEKSGKKFDYPVKWGIDLQSEHERYITEEYVKAPVIVINYPKEIKAFYMRLNEDGKTVRAMDVLVPRLGEIIGGSQREERYDVLKDKIVECGLNLEDYWWYLELRKYGTVPHSGFGFGLERFLMYVTGIQNIRDVSPFPRYPGYAKF